MTSEQTKTKGKICPNNGFLRTRVTTSGLDLLHERKLWPLYCKQETTCVLVKFRINITCFLKYRENAWVAQPVKLILNSPSLHAISYFKNARFSTSNISNRSIRSGLSACKVLFKCYFNLCFQLSQNVQWTNVMTRVIVSLVNYISQRRPLFFNVFFEPDIDGEHLKKIKKI